MPPRLSETPVDDEALMGRLEDFPSVPDPTIAGGLLDVELMQPTPEVAPDADPLTATVARGDDLLQEV